MKHSEDNLRVIQNFILFITHCGDHGLDTGYDEIQTWTPKQLYEMAEAYIVEDHVDGEDNHDDEFLYRFVCHFNDIVETASKEFQDWYNALSYVEKQKVIDHYRLGFKGGLEYGLSDPTADIMQILASDLDTDFRAGKKILG